MKNIDIDNILKAETDQLKKLENIVCQTVDDESLIIENLLNPPAEILTRGQSI